MISKKNFYSLEKTLSFFQEYPIILIYQHNNLTVKQHIDLKIKLQQQDNVKTLIVKNSILEKVCSSLLQDINNSTYHSSCTVWSNSRDKIKINNNENKLQNLLQGPVFLLGFHQLEELKTIWDILKMTPNFVLLGGQVYNQLYTHLDIKSSLEINNTIYHDLLYVINQQINNQNNILYYNILSVFDIAAGSFLQNKK